MFLRLVSDIGVFCANGLDVHYTDFIPLMSAVANVRVKAGGGLLYLPLYPAEEYISRYIHRYKARLFAMMPVSQSLSVRMGSA